MQNICLTRITFTINKRIIHSKIDNLLLSLVSIILMPMYSYSSILLTMVSE